METCKKNRRESTKATYVGHYRRVQKGLGWRKLSELNLIVMQQVFNELGTDNERKNSQKILVDMMEKAIDYDLLIKNTAKQINAVISKESKKERRVLIREETELFLAQAEDTFYYNLYVLALETGQPTQTFIVKECIELTVKQLRQQGHEFESFSAHCFRHTFATRAIENGVTPKTLQRLLGHGSLMMTMDLY